MGTALVVQSRETHGRTTDTRLVGMAPRTHQTWLAMLTMADDGSATYSLGWRQLSYATGMASERTVMRCLSQLRDVGLVTPLPRIPGAFRAYRLHP